MSTTVTKIRPLEGYGHMTDADIVARGTAVLTGLTGNLNFQNLPADLAVLQNRHREFLGAYFGGARWK